MSLIRIAEPADLEELYRLNLKENQPKDQGYFERCLDEQAEGKRDVLVVYDGEQMAGYCHYQRRPGYQPFRSMGLAEIQDLYVHPDHRQKGLAASLIEYCCQKAREEGQDLIGIGVGLNSNYGKAQRLYVKMGFEPDGAGAVYERKPVMPEQRYKIDDELCLMMIKRLD